MKRIILALVSVFAIGLTVTAAAPQPASAAVNVFQNCAGNSSAVCKATGDKLFGAGSVWNKILTTLTYVTGAVSVLMIVVGAFRYTISAGDQGAITGAKNTILYAVVGLVLSVTAYAIVNFVLSNI
jgi:hypothetical protein